MKRLIQITGKTVFFSEKFLKLLVECLSNVNSACYCAAYHRVVTDSEEAHHLNDKRTISMGYIK